MSAPKVYSYTRFSTPEQAQGDSKRRQSDMAARWMAANPGLPLDTELKMHDAGVSSFRGGNFEPSACLGAFVQSARDGDVARGSVLLIEGFDRASREPPRRAVAKIGEIVDLGIDVVTLRDGKRYSAETFDNLDLIVAVVQMMTAHEESRKKSERIGAAWAAKRAGQSTQGYGRTMNAISRVVPGWVRVEADGTRAAIPEREKVLKRIFQMRADGAGRQQIAKTLTKEKIPTWGTGSRRASVWHQAYILKILRNPAVLGTFTPGMRQGKKHVAQTPIENYYPAVIDPELFERVQSMEGSKGTRNVQGKVRNILATLARCPACGVTMTRVTKGSGKRDKLVCQTARKGGACSYKSVDLAAVTGALVRYLPEQGLPSKTEGLDEAIRGAEAGLDLMLGPLENLIRQVEAGSVGPTMVAKIAAKEAGIEKARAHLADLQRQASETDSKLLKRRGERLKAALSAQPLDPAAANAVLRECLHSVTVDYRIEFLILNWKHDGETRIPYEEFSDLDIGARMAKMRAARKPRKPK